MQMNATLCFHFLKREISWLHTKLPLSDGGVAFVSTTQNQVLHVFPPHKNSIFANEIIIIQTFLCSFLLFGWVRWKRRRFQLGIWMNYFILKDFRFKKNWRKYAFSVISLWRFTVFLTVLCSYVHLQLYLPSVYFSETNIVIRPEKVEYETKKINDFFPSCNLPLKWEVFKKYYHF